VGSIGSNPAGFEVSVLRPKLLLLFWILHYFCSLSTPSPNKFRLFINSFVGMSFFVHTICVHTILFSKSLFMNESLLIWASCRRVLTTHLYLSTKATTCNETHISVNSSFFLLSLFFLSLFGRKPPPESLRTQQTSPNCCTPMYSVPSSVCSLTSPQESPMCPQKMIVGALVIWAIYTQGQLLLWSSLIITGVVPGYK